MEQEIKDKAAIEFLDRKVRGLSICGGIGVFIIVTYLAWTFFTGKPAEGTLGFIFNVVYFVFVGFLFFLGLGLLGYGFRWNDNLVRNFIGIGMFGLRADRVITRGIRWIIVISLPVGVIWLAFSLLR